MFPDASTSVESLAPPVWNFGADRVTLRHSNVTVGDLAGVFADEAARSALPDAALVYTTEIAVAGPEDDGGLLSGTTMLLPGLVGDEYFMTRGHFHARRSRAEFYWCLQGEGMLILMDEDRRCTVEAMWPGSAHYVPGHTAHRAVNVGRNILSFTACWPADAGHDYASIASHGFPVRVLRAGGAPRVVEVPR
jgi:glucose-6-phosphate isomerase